MTDFQSLRDEMVDRQLRARGIHDEKVLAAMAEVPRERFIPEDLVEFAYKDSALPIDEEQTISQPYMVALMAQALELSNEDVVLDVGTGSGYAAAVVSRIAKQVYSIERHAPLAEAAAELLTQLGYDNISVRHGDGTKGWPAEAPFQAIQVAAGGEDIPDPLKEQLAVRGHLVIPIGAAARGQQLLKLTKRATDEFDQEKLGAVRFVPLVEGQAPGKLSPQADDRQPPSLLESLQKNAETFESIEGVELDRFLERTAQARLVLLGEASHGTSEFYRMRARLTQELIEHHGFNIVAVEADWPDAAFIDRYIRGTQLETGDSKPFSRFPTWMWANQEVLDFLNWLRGYNQGLSSSKSEVGFYGLDLYSMYSSIEAVLAYLDDVDPEAASVARQRYGCLSPWEQEPASYGAAALRGQYKACESEVVANLQHLMEKRVSLAGEDGYRFLNAVQNARLVANAERYYRLMYYGSDQSWNLRDQHMFDTLTSLLQFHGEDAKAVVWEHNSHIGDARATEMSARGQHNVGQLARQSFGQEAYLLGFGTDHGTVAAASQWGGAMEVMRVRPSHEDSYENLFHRTKLPAFQLPLRQLADSLKDLEVERLERAIGVIYRPETELQSHYFFAELPNQFDEYIWFDETKAVQPLVDEPAEAADDLFPFGI